MLSRQTGVGSSSAQDQTGVILNNSYKCLTVPAESLASRTGSEHALVRDWIDLKDSSLKPQSPPRGARDSAGTLNMHSY